MLYTCAIRSGKLEWVFGCESILLSVTGFECDRCVGMRHRVRVLRVCARVMGVIGIIGLRLAPGRPTKTPPGRKGRVRSSHRLCYAPNVAACHGFWPPVSPAVRPLGIPATALRFAPSRGRYAGPPPWGAARLATLGCAAVMLFAGQRTKANEMQKARHPLAWYGLVPSCSVVPPSHSRPQPSGGTAPLAAAVPSTMLQGPASIGQECRT
jgi:hypothetical protein